MSNEARYIFNTKIGQDILTVRGDSADEFLANIDDIIDSLGKVGELAEAARAVATVVTQIPGATVVGHTQDTPQVATPGTVETLEDRWGNKWTYNLPDAPELPDGRGKYALKAGTARSGKAYRIFEDPSAGPKPFPKGAVKAESIWPKG